MRVSLRYDPRAASASFAPHELAMKHASIYRCPRCQHQPLEAGNTRVDCPRCAHSYPILFDVPLLFSQSEVVPSPCRVTVSQCQQLARRLGAEANRLTPFFVQQVLDYAYETADTHLKYQDYAPCPDAAESDCTAAEPRWDTLVSNQGREATPPERVLVVGPLNPTLRRQLPGQVYHVDTDVHTLQLCQVLFGNSSPLIQGVAADVSSVPFAEGVFDFALLTRSFRHYKKPSELIQRIRKALKPVGRLLVLNQASRYHLVP